MTAILAISVALIMGLLMTRVLKPLKLPDVTAYLIAGVLIGPYVLGRLNVPGAVCPYFQCGIGIHCVYHR